VQPHPKDKSQPSDAGDAWADDQQKREYYYDDAHGYETYRSDQTPTIYTIGHSTRDLADLVRLLKENSIEFLADVRSFPGSRKFPHFNKEILEAEMPDNDIEYVHLKLLGGRRRVRPDSPHTVWRNESFRAYADYMETEEFKLGIEELLDIAEEGRTALMCSEAVWWRCHRSMISDYLKAAGITVLHIMGDDKVVEHPFTSAAKIKEGRLVYGSAD
jgi:uncharacterized protein (DUF488 family)